MLVCIQSSVGICVCDDDYLSFAGSQQSQDQTTRRSGNTGEKHNENGVRLLNFLKNGWIEMYLH